MVKLSPVYLIAGAAVLAAVVWAVSRKGGAGVGSAVAGAVIGAADGAIGETVNSIGEVIGVPRTNASRCELAKAAGDTWAASFDCPAGEFLRYVFD
ncbi:hypothetical protein [uncultured Hydrogenophaga sp.]|uniref:hypothetical protein n=1 Tax=uncultured Hydrogenophaga sp. TaxID=199683 RepID=UPI00265E2F17|nr:hypothetical protein [uncultured Hydrogenophaga sp.]